MTREEAFKEISRSSRRIAELCDQQKDTVAWWTEYGEELQKFNDAVLDSAPLKKTHRGAARTAMEKVSIK